MTTCREVILDAFLTAADDSSNVVYEGQLPWLQNEIHDRPDDEAKGSTMCLDLPVVSAQS